VSSHFASRAYVKRKRIERRHLNAGQRAIELADQGLARSSLADLDRATLANPRTTNAADALACYQCALIGGPPRTGIRTSPLFQKRVATMITKECFGCEKVTSHEHLHDCAPDIPETHIVGSERFVCVLCKHVTFAGSDGASRFPFTFDKVAAGR